MKLFVYITQICFYAPVLVRASWCVTSYNHSQHFDQKKQPTTRGSLFSNPVVPFTAYGHDGNLVQVDWVGFYAVDPSISANGNPIEQGLRARSKPKVAVASLMQSPDGIGIYPTYSSGSWDFSGYSFGCLSYSPDVGVGVPVNCTVNVTSSGYGEFGSGSYWDLTEFSVEAGAKIAPLKTLRGSVSANPPYLVWSSWTFVPDPPDVVVVFDEFKMVYVDLWPTSTGNCDG